MYALSRRRSGALALIVVGILSVYAGLLWHTPQVASTGPRPPPPSGGNGGNGDGGTGTGGNGGGSGGGSPDTQAPTTTISIVGRGYAYFRSGVQYYTSNFTVTLNSTDNVHVQSIFLTDNQSSVVLPAVQSSDGGRVAWTSTTITTKGLHLLRYYAEDNSSNVEEAHTATRGIGRSLLSDLALLIENSGIDNAGIKNSMLAKVNAAEGQQARGQPMNSLNALTNQLNALDGKHGLTDATVKNIEAMIQEIQAADPANGSSTLQSAALKNSTAPGASWILPLLLLQTVAVVTVLVAASGAGPRGFRSTFAPMRIGCP